MLSIPDIVQPRYELLIAVLIQLVTPERTVSPRVSPEINLTPVDANILFLSYFPDKYNFTNMHEGLLDLKFCSNN
jgi:hypothetical protein